MSDQEMDRLLRQSMAAPIPRLSTACYQGLSRELRRNCEAPGQFGRVLMASYGVVSAAVCVVVMRGQGLGWEAIALATLGPLAAFEVARRARGRRWGMAAR
jgi:hypothetical protein